MEVLKRRHNGLETPDSPPPKYMDDDYEPIHVSDEKSTGYDSEKEQKVFRKYYSDNKASRK